jgi:hypothetical protein
MTPREIGLTVVACIFGSALLGVWLRKQLPDHHVGDDAKDIVKLGLSLIGTLAALVMGLLISSASASFNTVSNELTTVTVKVLQLDHLLYQYGPEANEVRGLLTKNFGATVEFIFSRDPARHEAMLNPNASSRQDEVQAGIRRLSPGTDEQRELRSRALDLAYDAGAERWYLVLQHAGTISAPVLAVLVSWLCVIFFGWGLFAPRHALMMSALFTFASCATLAIFLVLELDSPFEGWVRVSDAPMRMALVQLGR